jgi:glycine/D-amino acid oxidase-like deaminating enzyme
VSRAGDAEVVIVGGGAFGCAVAYFLARAGKRDVVLLGPNACTGTTTPSIRMLRGRR